MRSLCFSLVNVGNSCYMNAVIQALLGIPSFKEHLLSPPSSIANAMASIPLYRCVRTCVFDLRQIIDSLLCSAFHQVAKGLEEVAHISCLFFFPL